MARIWNYFGDFTDAARLILRFNDGGAAALLRMEFPAIMKAKLIELMPAKDFSMLSDDAIIALLLSSDDEIRRGTARKVPTSVTRSRVTKTERVSLARRGAILHRYTLVGPRPSLQSGDGSSCRRCRCSPLTHGRAFDG